MLTLFHYTCERAIRHIRADGLLLPSRIAGVDGHPIDDTAISLTTDVDPYGHGLPDGREIPSAQHAASGLTVSRDGRWYLEDATEFRITFQVDPNDPALVFVPSYYKPNPDVLLVLAITGHLPNGVNAASDAEFLAAATRAGTELSEQRSKIHTWWYYFGQLSVSESQISIVRSPSSSP